MNFSLNLIIYFVKLRKKNINFWGKTLQRPNNNNNQLLYPNIWIEPRTSWQIKIKSRQRSALQELNADWPALS